MLASQIQCYILRKGNRGRYPLLQYDVQLLRDLVYKVGQCLVIFYTTEDIPLSHLA